MVISGNEAKTIGVVQLTNDADPKQERHNKRKLSNKAGHGKKTTNYKPKKENYSSDFWAKTSQIIKREDFKHPRQCQAERRWDILMTCSPYLCGFIHPRTKNFHISIEMQTIAERR